MTFLELVNAVLVRLREPEVTNVTSNKYTKLIAALVNDAKRAVEDAAPWVQLTETISVTTSSGVADYDLVDTNERSTVYSVIADTSKLTLRRSSARHLIEQKQRESSNGTPDRWAVIGTATTGELKLRLYPTPSGAVDYSVNAYIPDADLVNNSDTLSVPSEPVFMRAYAYAIKERGEDNGQAYREALDQARNVLARYLVLNNSSAGTTGQWQVR